MSNGRDWSSVEVFKKKKILIINVNLKCMLFLMYDIWKYDKKKKRWYICLYSKRNESTLGKGFIFINFLKYFQPFFHDFTCGAIPYPLNFFLKSEDYVMKGYNSKNIYE